MQWWPSQVKALKYLVTTLTMIKLSRSDEILRLLFERLQFKSGSLHNENTL